MKKIKMNLNIDWRSKIIDLLIVIVGISIAFKLNTWNETIKMELEEQDYIESFYEENTANEINLVSALEFSESNKADIDTLKQILATKNYLDKRIKILAASMMGLASYNPSIITMENITAYINEYLTPFFFDNVRFSDFSSIHSNFIKDPLFENIVFGYEVLLSQQISGYQDNLEKIKLLNNQLTTLTIY